MIIFLNSKFIKIKPSQFDQYLPGTLSGVGVFETMRLYNGSVFAFDEHMQRLKRGCKHFGLKLSLSHQSIYKVIKQLNDKTRLSNARVRVIVWREKKINISISLQELNLPTRAKYQSGYKVMTSKFKRDRGTYTHLKSLNYAIFKKAYADAYKKGYDEAILFNSKGYLVEGTRTNIFFVKNGKLFTPLIGCGCLNGITRNKVIQCARGLGISVKMVEVFRDTLIKADEAFLTGSTLEIMPLKSVDKKSIGNGQPGEMTALLQSAYKTMINKVLS